MDEQEENPIAALKAIEPLPQLIMRPFYTGWKKQVCGNCEFWRKLAPQGVRVIGSKSSETGHCSEGAPNLLALNNSAPTVPGNTQNITVTRATLPANFPACGQFLPENFASKLTYGKESTTNANEPNID